MDLTEKAVLLRELHHAPPLLVLPNAWDVESARRFAALPGCRAIATSSAAVARALGYEDGQRAPAAEMIESARRIAGSVEVPVTADLERGYGDPVGTARAAWAAGVAGMNVEDADDDGLASIDEQVGVLKEIRRAVPELVVNARVDVFIRELGGVEDAVARAEAYLAAGADCVYPILCPSETVGELAQRIPGPVNVYVTTGGPSPSELERLGVARMTWGPGLARAAYSEATRLVEQAFSDVR